MRTSFSRPVHPHRLSTHNCYQRSVNLVIQAMLGHLDEPLDLAKFAHVAAMSPFHFHRVFKEVVGITPGKFLATLRLETAKRLLQSTDLPVTEICLDVGYNSLGTFTTLFTRSVGLAPGRFRHVATSALKTKSGVAGDEVGSRRGKFFWEGATAGITDSVLSRKVSELRLAPADVQVRLRVFARNAEPPNQQD